MYQQIRRRLGIPDDAEQILIFSESSHWDPNWLFTSEEYFERFVRLYALAVPEAAVMATLFHFWVTKAFLCDARERDLEQLLRYDCCLQNQLCIQRSPFFTVKNNLVYIELIEIIPQLDHKISDRRNNNRKTVFIEVNTSESFKDR